MLFFERQKKKALKKFGLKTWYTKKILLLFISLTKQATKNKIPFSVLVFY